MDKYLLLLFSVFAITTCSTAALGNNIPDFCNSEKYQCHQIDDNYVIAYPVTNDGDQLQSDSNPSQHTSYQTSVISPHQPDIIEIDLSNLTWSAYNEEGYILRSGAVSGGKDYCPDIQAECSTVTGTFTIFRKGDENCKSTKFPVGRGGAPMPFCMFFYGGYALHGSNFVPDYNASHGCVRMSPEDAQWLNEEFVQVGITKVNIYY